MNESILELSKKYLVRVGMVSLRYKKSILDIYLIPHALAHSLSRSQSRTRLTIRS